jgi:hypothetical protein
MRTKLLLTFQTGVGVAGFVTTAALPGGFVSRWIGTIVDGIAESSNGSGAVAALEIIGAGG